MLQMRSFLGIGREDGNTKEFVTRKAEVAAQKRGLSRENLETKKVFRAEPRERGA